MKPIGKSNGLERALFPPPFSESDDKVGVGLNRFRMSVISPFLRSGSEWKDVSVVSSS